MNKLLIPVILVVYLTMSSGQRPSFAGVRPQSGYKDRYKPETSTNATTDLSERIGEELAANQTQRPPVFINVVQPDPNFIPIIGDRVDENPAQNPNVTQSTQTIISESTTRLPYDALGDKELVDRLNRLPPDQRPFWLLNAQAIEAHRNRIQAQGQQNSILNQQQSQQGFFASGGLLGINRGGNPQFNQGEFSLQQQEQALLFNNRVVGNNLRPNIAVTTTSNQLGGTIGVESTTFGAITNQNLGQIGGIQQNVNQMQFVQTPVSTESTGASLGSGNNNINLVNLFNTDAIQQTNPNQKSAIQSNRSGFPNFGKTQP